MALFRAQGAGHLVLVSSVAGVRGMAGTRTAYSASKAGLTALGEGIRADVLGSDIVVTTVLPGFIATDINTGRRGPFTVGLDVGVRALVDAVEREPVRAYVPGWPWRPVAGLLRVLPLPVVRRVSRVG
jgi:NAD(P)-dependent dehydrogenase (short-subunit alcohol dehydrogenase family)